MAINSQESEGREALGEEWVWESVSGGSCPGQGLTGTQRGQDITGQACVSPPSGSGLVEEESLTVTGLCYLVSLFPATICCVPTCSAPWVTLRAQSVIAVLGALL